MRLLGCVGAVVLFAVATQARAQKPVGTVPVADAVITNADAGVVAVNGGRAVVSANSTVTAKDRTAAIALERGGEVRVCQTSGLHVAASADDSLLLALDRGALEIKMKARTGDVVMTPDLRFTLSEAAPLDLQMRVTINGDTCVDNRGHKAPTLKISDAFGEAEYELKPGQHVMFEHGSLRAVVDQETTPCGCPPDEKKNAKSVSLAEAAIAAGASKGQPVTAEQAAAAHPFPDAVSEGLAAPTPLPAEAPGQTHVQVASTLAYDPAAPKLPVAEVPAESDIAARIQPAPPPQRNSANPFKAIGRFFKRLFVR